MFLLPLLLAASSLFLLSHRSPAVARACQLPPGTPNQVSRLVGVNGLYALPQLVVTRPPSLYDTAYGLMALRALGHSTSTTASKAEIRRLVATEPSGSVVWARWYLLAIQQATGKPILGAADADAVRKTFVAGGYVDERPAGAPPAPAAELISGTAAALDILVATRGEAFTRQLTATRTWIRQAAARDSGHPYVTWQAARAMQNLGLPIPETLISRSTDWMAAQLRDRPRTDFGSAAHDLFGYVSLMRAARRPIPANVYSFFRPLLEQATGQRDSQLVYYVATSMAKSKDELLSRIGSSVASRRLRTGLLAENAQIIGSVDASYYVEAIRAAQGTDSCDPGLATALRGFDSDQWNSLDPVAKGMWVASMKMASGDVDETRRNVALRAMLADLPEVLSPDNVRRWALESELIVRLGGKVPPVATAGWLVKDRLSVVGSSTLALAYADLGLSLKTLTNVRADDLKVALESPALTPTTDEYFDALQSYVMLGNRLTQAMVKQSRERVAAVGDCTVARILVRTAPNITDCDLRATLSLDRARKRISSLDSGQ
jgi:hypothetical protein